MRVEDARHLFDGLFLKLARQESGDYILVKGEYQVAAEEEPEYEEEDRKTG